MVARCGFIGLPNVGKSTMFNVATASNIAAAANYPFCTIEPNIATVTVPDPRLQQLADLARSAKVIPTYTEFVDIAGIVKGASQGEGLGNKFLAHIREVDVIIHVIRAFESSAITHVYGHVDPIRDAEIIDTELILADLESVEKKLAGLSKKIKSHDPEITKQHTLLTQIHQLLISGKPARLIVNKDNQKDVKNLQLLTTKKVLYVCNVEEEHIHEGNQYTTQIAAKALAEGAMTINISAQIEAEIAVIEDPEDKKQFLASLGLAETGFNKLINTAYELLGLKSYFTVGPKEARAWSFPVGTAAPQAAGIIHSDFERGFIRAEVIGFEDYIKYQGEQGAKEAGKMRVEGREYIINDGDVVHFRFNV